MQISTITAIMAFGTAAASATTINLFSATKCADGDYIKTLGGLKSGCHKFGVANVKAVDTRNLSGKCTVTVYSDASCSDHATPARLDECVPRAGGWQSFSVDNC
ncbi:uncharacterized protein JN550_011726 [Neoarthrinium moseri]|uniref:uncharacterized protein n=1 Tax=Neoarthrinium moseri TaxID=1658444 RepID=UPI001FDB5E55|nr:uncharacterized protein JN550_011726 [Neoarthrinium moseri]KAI1860042.1 hypothetical protein JN550_011726 [Neoarthrinium moseri]